MRPMLTPALNAEHGAGLTQFEHRGRRLSVWANSGNHIGRIARPAVPLQVSLLQTPPLTVAVARTGFPI